MIAIYVETDRYEKSSIGKKKEKREKKKNTTKTKLVLLFGKLKPKLGDS